MAQDFNPEVKQVPNENFMNWSRPIETPQANKSKYYALKGVGQVAGEGIKAADEVMQMYVTNETQRRGTALREDYKSRLEEATAYVKGLDADGNEKKDSMDILSSDGKKSPAAVARMASTLDKFYSMKENGDLSETGYKGWVDALAKDLRGQFPSYRHIIDRETERTTGVAGANAYLGGMLADLRAYGEKKNEAKNKAIALLSNQDNFDALVAAGKDPAKIISGVNDGTITPADGMRATYEAAAKRAKHKGIMQDIEELKGDKEAQLIKTKEAMTKRSSEIVQGHMEELIKAMPKDASENGLQGEDAIRWGMKVTETIQKVEAELNKAYHSKGADEDKTPAERMTEEKTQEDIKAYLTPFKNISKAGTAEEVTFANFQAQLMKAWNTDAMVAVFRKYPAAAYMKIFEEAGGKEYASLMVPFLGKVLAGDQGHFSKSMIEATSPDEIFTKNGMRPPPSTMREILKTQKSDKAIGEGEEAAGSKGAQRLYGATASIPTSVITNRTASEEKKAAVIKRTFSPDDAGFISSIASDSWVTRQDGTKTFAPGKETLFKDLYSPQMVKEMHKRSSRDWEQYVRYGLDTFGNEVLPDLHSLTDAKNNGLINLAWDPDTHQWAYNVRPRKGDELKFSYGRATPEGEVDLGTRRLTEGIDRVNKGLSALVNLAKADKSINVDSFLISAMLRLQYDKDQGVILEMLQSVMPRQKEQNGPTTPQR